MRCVLSHTGMAPTEPFGRGCFRCNICHHWIRPHKYEDDCDDCTRADNMAAGLCPKGHTPTDSERKGWKRCAECKCEWGDGVISYSL
jgi:hypothetical protein